MVAVITLYLLITLDMHLSASLQLLFSAFRASYVKNLVVKGPASHPKAESRGGAAGQEVRVEVWSAGGLLSLGAQGLRVSPAEQRCRAPRHSRPAHPPLAPPAAGSSAFLAGERCLGMPLGSARGQTGHFCIARTLHMTRLDIAQKNKREKATPQPNPNKSNCVEI